MGSTFFGNEAGRVPAQKNPARIFISLCQKILSADRSIPFFAAKVIDTHIKKPGQHG
jgi:hypothetical protein